MEKHPYIIMAPEYRYNSAGVRALYELQKQLIKRGYEAEISRSGNAPDKAIVVYPETVTGNPLNGLTVARYVLNYPGLLGGEKEYDADEIIFSYVPEFYPGAQVLTIPVIEDFFKDMGLKRKGGCFWVGKGIDLERIPETEGLTEITYDWPETREELAKLFNEKEVFYSYDDNTALITEARLCGCKVVIIPGEKHGSYDESVKDFENQLDKFIEITQAAANKQLKILFGAMINDHVRFDMCLKQTEFAYKLHFVANPEKATTALNQLLDLMKKDGADIAILTHQDMCYRRGWLKQVRKQIAQLPDSWVVAGIIGKDMKGNICGKFHDMRMVPVFNTSDIHEFPHEASCFDECCIIVNLKKGLRFDEGLTGFDLYGTECVLQAWEIGGTAWIIDAFAEHYCMRPFSWEPNEQFKRNFKWLYNRFPNAKRLDTTAVGSIKEDEAA